MITVQDALIYLGYADNADEEITSIVTRCVNTAKSLVEGAVGKNAYQIMKCHEKLDELALIYVGDLYYNRELSAKNDAGQRNLVKTLIFQSQLEYQEVIDNGNL
ncbi:MAG: head-tail connector protein [Acutalibacteraceae bacterium]